MKTGTEISYIETLMARPTSARRRKLARSEAQDQSICLPADVLSQLFPARSARHKFYTPGKPQYRTGFFTHSAEGFESEAIFPCDVFGLCLCSRKRIAADRPEIKPGFSMIERKVADMTTDL